MPLAMSAGTGLLGLYLAIIGGTPFALFGWVLFGLGMLGVSAVTVLDPPTRRPRPGAPPSPGRRRERRS